MVQDTNRKSMGTFEYLYLVSAIVGIISTFMPFIGISLFGQSETINLVRPMGQIGDGVVYIALFVIGLIFLFVKIRMGTLVTSILNLLLLIYTMSSYSSQMKKGDIPRDLVKLQIGAYLLMISIILLVFSGIMIFISKKDKDPFEEDDYWGRVNTNSKSVEEAVVEGEIEEMEIGKVENADANALDEEEVFQEQAAENISEVLDKEGHNIDKDNVL